MTYSVIVMHQNGERDTGPASNVTLERAQAVQAMFSPRFPGAQVLIEPQPVELQTGQRQPVQAPTAEPQPAAQEECLFPASVQPQK